MKRRTWIQSALASGSVALAGASSWKETPPKAFLSQLPPWMEVAPVPGVWITWLNRGKVAWAHGYGVKSVATKQPVDG